MEHEVERKVRKSPGTYIRNMETDIPHYPDQQLREGYSMILVSIRRMESEALVAGITQRLPSLQKASLTSTGFDGAPRMS